MRRSVFSVLTLVFMAAPLRADQVVLSPLVIDTDVALDDVVTLALALQSSDTEVVSIVACEGVASRRCGVEHLERMLDLFNRRDVRLYAPADLPARPAPPFRAFAERAVSGALPEDATPFHQPFVPEAYRVEGRRVTVLALGPLTNIAAALKARPELRREISTIIISGTPPPDPGWNLRYDAEALSVVRDSGVSLRFIAPGAAGTKPQGWGRGDFRFGQETSAAERFIRRLLADDQVREHYVFALSTFHDELALLYHLDAALFGRGDRADLYVPRNADAVNRLFNEVVCEGRQHKTRVVFGNAMLPADVFDADVRERRERIIAKNGPTEWFSQIVMNELHDHLGAYSIVGVKMGLRAAELLNAPRSAIRVESHTPPGPPISCLNDGVIVGTGSTPGRALFTHVPGKPGTVEVAFTYNSRTLTLRLKDEYRGRIQDRIEQLRGAHGLDDPEYWAGVRRFGLDIWENWHRRDLFEVRTSPSASSSASSPGRSGSAG